MGREEVMRAKKRSILNLYVFTASIAPAISSDSMLI